MCTVLLPPGVNPVAVNKYTRNQYQLFRETSDLLLHFPAGGSSDMLKADLDTSFMQYIDTSFPKIQNMLNLKLFLLTP
jgi:hypothetical protein